ncbi:hypothetical protein MRX96_032653 [Rhipicephalus microplus]
MLSEPTASDPGGRQQKHKRTKSVTSTTVDHQDGDVERCRCGGGAMEDRRGCAMAKPLSVVPWSEPHLDARLSSGASACRPYLSWTLLDPGRLHVRADALFSLPHTLSPHCVVFLLFFFCLS